MATTNTYTGNLGAIENNISSLTKAVSQGYSGLPGITDSLRKSLYEREKTLPALERDNESKITELYTADKTYAERYANPQSDMYIENPMQRTAIGAGQKADIRGEYGNILDLIQQRSQVLGNALDKGIELYKYGLQAQEFELQQAQSAWDRAFKKQQADKTSSGEANKTAGISALVQNMLMGKMVTPPTESQSELQTPTDTSVNWRSPQGQWEWDATTKQWMPSGQTDTETYKNNIMDILKQYPEISDTVYKNISDIFPGTFGTETQDLDAAVTAISNKTAELSDFPTDLRTKIIKRAQQKGITLPSIDPYGLNTGAGATVDTTAQDAKDAQANIDKFTSPIEKANVYQKIIQQYPALVGKIHP